MEKLKLIISSKHGFTLIEALVVVAVIGIIGFIMVDLLQKSLANSSKTSILSAVKRNGQVASNIIDQTARSADAIICPLDQIADTTLVIYKNGQYIRFRFDGSSSTKNGSIKQDFPTGVTQATLSTLCSQSDPLVNPVSLTDTNTLTGVSVSLGTFSRIIQSPNKDAVIIQFWVGPPIKARTGFESQLEAVRFKTTVQLR